jgi:ABC-type Na+ efflux pump permease subunit
LRPSVNWPQLLSRVDSGWGKKKPFTAKIAKKIRKVREETKHVAIFVFSCVFFSSAAASSSFFCVFLCFFAIVFFAIFAAVLRALRGSKLFLSATASGNQCRSCSV